ncbi:MAG TPA: hypothetical protein VIN37_06975 [Candidatus Limnocylindria bacterium]
MLEKSMRTAVLVHERLDVAAQRRHEPEVVEDHRAELEDEAAQLLQRLVHHLAERRELLARTILVHAVEALADLRLQDDVRHRLGGAVVDLAGDPPPLLLLSVDDGLEELVLIEDRRRVRGHRRGAEVGKLVTRAADQRLHPIEQLALRLQGSHLAFHREPAPLGGGELVAGGHDLRVRPLRADAVELRLRGLLALLQAVDLGLGGLDQEVELAHLGGDLRLFGREAGDNAARRLRHPGGHASCSSPAP